ncbi:hypothetical protein M5K25_002437 [Dendrobium thyrsiflorum]|uniref:Uncharacterized protein n=1 Tax=Dendrobium thyrsiflorum TaxID=117978 RepID=A0ABD0VN84_DENTH
MDPSDIHDQALALCELKVFCSPDWSKRCPKLFKSLSLSDKISATSRRLSRLGENYEKTGPPATLEKNASHRVPFPPRLKKARIGGYPVRHERRKWSFTCLAEGTAPDSLPTTLGKSVHELVFRCAANAENMI